MTRKNLIFFQKGDIVPQEGDKKMNLDHELKLRISSKMNEQIENFAEGLGGNSKKAVVVRMAIEEFLAGHSPHLQDHPKNYGGMGKDKSPHVQRARISPQSTTLTKPKKTRYP